MHRIAIASLVTSLLAGFAGSAAAGTPPATTTTPSSGSVPPLQAEATQAAQGDIPDNQVFVTYKSPGYTIKFPEGWARSGSGNAVTFRDKNNIIRIVVEAKHHAAAKTTYRTQSAPNPVTGKRVTLLVVRYYKPKAGKTAIIDLAGPVGVDNVDAYKLIANSFKWR